MIQQQSCWAEAIWTYIMYYPGIFNVCAEQILLSQHPYHFSEQKNIKITVQPSFHDSQRDAPL